jgi:hypothetical protein
MACGYGSMDDFFDDPRYIALMEKMNLPMPKN